MRDVNARVSIETSRNVIIARDPQSYSSHPSIARLADGDWLVAFARSERHDGHFIHPPDDPGFVNMLTRSSDQGRTWSPPRAIPGPGWSGVECPGITQISNGDVLLNQWRFLWHPVETARRLWSDGQQGLFVFDPAVSRWRPAVTSADWDHHPLPYARADDGAYVHVSTDSGRSWGITVELDISPYQGAFSPNGAAQLSSGDIVLGLGSHEHDPLAAVFVVRSSDAGRTWSPPVEVARVQGLVFSEPSIVATPEDTLLVFCREEATGYVYLSESRDGGFSWRPVRKLPLWGYPTHGLRLREGWYLAIFGVRRRPFGIHAAVSEDGGANWGSELKIRTDLADARSGLNMGYPSVIEYEPGRLFVAYYAEDPDGVTCIQGTYFTLRSRDRRDAARNHGS